MSSEKRNDDHITRNDVGMKDVEVHQKHSHNGSGIRSRLRALRILRKGSAVVMQKASQKSQQSESNQNILHVNNRSTPSPPQRKDRRLRTFILPPPEKESPREQDEFIPPPRVFQTQSDDDTSSAPSQRTSDASIPMLVQEQRLPPSVATQEPVAQNLSPIFASAEAPPFSESPENETFSMFSCSREQEESSNIVETPSKTSPAGKDRPESDETASPITERHREAKSHTLFDMFQKSSNPETSVHHETSPIYEPIRTNSVSTIPRQSRKMKPQTRFNGDDISPPRKPPPDLLMRHPQHKIVYPYEYPDNMYELELMEAQRRRSQGCDYSIVNPAPRPTPSKKHVTPREPIKPHQSTLEEDRDTLRKYWDLTRGRSSDVQSRAKSAVNHKKPESIHVDAYDDTSAMLESSDSEDNEEVLRTRIENRQVKVDYIVQTLLVAWEAHELSASRILQSKRVREIFHLFDPQDTGAIERSKISELIAESTGLSLSEEETANIVDRLDDYDHSLVLYDILSDALDQLILHLLHQEPQTPRLPSPRRRRSVSPRNARTRHDANHRLERYANWINSLRLSRIHRLDAAKLVYGFQTGTLFGRLWKHFARISGENQLMEQKLSGIQWNAKMFSSREPCLKNVQIVCDILKEELLNPDYKLPSAEDIYAGDPIAVEYVLNCFIAVQYFEGYMWQISTKTTSVFRWLENSLGQIGLFLPANWMDNPSESLWSNFGNGTMLFYLLRNFAIRESETDILDTLDTMDPNASENHVKMLMMLIKYFKIPCALITKDFQVQLGQDLDLLVFLLCCIYEKFSPNWPEVLLDHQEEDFASSQPMGAHQYYLNAYNE